MTFETMAEERLLPIDVDPLSIIQEGNGKIMLPKFSINTILVNEVITGIEDYASNAFEVYPNPASSTFTIKPKATNWTKVMIYNIVGEQVYESTAGASSLIINTNHHNIKPDMYIIHFVDNQFKKHSHKLIIK